MGDSRAVRAATDREIERQNGANYSSALEQDSPHLPAKTRAGQAPAVDPDSLAAGGAEGPSWSWSRPWKH